MKLMNNNNIRICQRRYFLHWITVAILAFTVSSVQAGVTITRITPEGSVSYQTDDGGIGSSGSSASVGCRNMLNKKDDKGNFVYWDKNIIGVSTLKDPTSAATDVETFYKSAFVWKYKIDEASFAEFCSLERAIIEYMNEHSWTKLVTGSSSEVCMEGLTKLCEKKFDSERFDERDRWKWHQMLE